MKTPGERGRVGTWLRDERTSRGWSDRELLARLRAAGLVVGVSTYREWEAGSRRPNPDRLARLEQFYGTSPDDTERGEAPADLASALRDLADAIRGQTLLLAALADVQGQQSVQVNANTDRIDSLAAALTRVLERDAQASPMPESRRASTE